MYTLLKRFGPSYYMFYYVHRIKMLDFEFEVLVLRVYQLLKVNNRIKIMYNTTLIILSVLL